MQFSIAAVKISIFHAAALSSLSDPRKPISLRFPLPLRVKLRNARSEHLWCEIAAIAGVIERR
jgi:hypothetical protein